MSQYKGNEFMILVTSNLGLQIYIFVESKFLILKTLCPKTHYLKSSIFINKPTNALKIRVTKCFQL